MSVCIILFLLDAASAVWPVVPLLPFGPNDCPPCFHGKVVALTKTGIIVKPEGTGLYTTAIRKLPNGRTRYDITYKQNNDGPPREFRFDDRLFPDRPGDKTARTWEHAVTDVLIGDIVQLGCADVRGAHSCVSLVIERRPGGKVPPAIGDEHVSPEGRANGGRIDDRYNAEQFAEETFVPKVLPWLMVNFGRSVPRENRFGGPLP